MKKIVLIAVGILLYLVPLQAQNLKVSLDYNTYSTDKLEPYIEFTFIVGGKSVKYADNGKGYNAEVEFLVEFEKENSMVDSFRYIIVSDSYPDTLPANKMDFADIVNFKIPNGSYILHFTIRDMHNPKSFIRYMDNIEVFYPEGKIGISGIRLLSSLSPASEEDFYVKYGYNMPPAQDHFYHQNMNVLPFVMEVYNTEKMIGTHQTFLVRSKIESAQNEWIKTPFLLRTATYETAPISIVVQQFDIGMLPSGNYNLVVEVLRPDSSVLASGTAFFQRSNPSIELDLTSYESANISNTFVSKYSDIKELQGFVASLYPIATPIEQDFFDKRMSKISLDQLQRFFFSFWNKRYPNNPEEEWLKYNEKVKYVQQTYGSKLTRGYRTDRGRVYLQYGPPNTIRESPYSPTTHPYEIWHYYYLDGQSNIRFVFYNTDLVSNDYQLLHSNKTGEAKDPAWQIKLLKGHLPIDNFDEKKPENFWGNDMDDNWDNP